MENKEGFRFTYSAEQQKEIEAIRQKYLPKEADKMQQLRKLHAVPSQKARAWAIAVGVIGALLLGTGMSLLMTELGIPLGEPATVLGLAVGILGLLLMALAYPVYDRVLAKQRRRIAPQILLLTEELMK